MLEWLMVRLGRVIWRRALWVGLIAAPAAVVIYSVDQANWVNGAAWWPLAWPALIGGAALARSRWHGWWALGYAVVLLAAGAAEMVGHVLPDVAQLRAAPGEWVWNLHLRSVQLALRAQAWATAVAQGRPVGDTGLFVALVALILGGAVAWLAWGVVRRRQAMAGCLPAALALTVNTYFSGQPWQMVLIFIVLVLALTIYTTYRVQNADWDRRGVDYPDDLGLDWATAAVGLTFSIGALGAVAPIVAAPSGWHLLADMLSTSRQQVVATADKLFTGVRPPNSGPAELVARTPDLTNIGAPVDQSQATLMWVTIDEPPPADYAGAPLPTRHYWRSGLYAAYTGTGWLPIALAPGADSPGPLPTAPTANQYVLRQRFEIAVEHGQTQFAVNHPVSASLDALVQPDALDAATTLLAGTGSSYTVDSLVTQVSQADLRAAGTAYPAAIRSAYLPLPAGLPARVGSLAAQIASGATNPFDEAQRLQDYLRRTYPYRLDVPPPPAGRDAVDYFLYEAPGGYCSYYASALAVMLRTVGVPARVATGYAMGEYDRDRGAYRVRGAAAHAWVEVYFPAYGWVEFEPTPAQAVFERPVGDKPVTPAPVRPGAGAPAPATPAWVVGLALLAVGLAVAGWGTWQFAARHRPSGPRERALALYAQARSALSRVGLSAPPSLTADEFLQARTAVLAERPPLLTSVTEMTRLFREAAYSRHALRDADVRAAERAWANSRWAWLRLALRRLVPGWERGSK